MLNRPLLSAPRNSMASDHLDMIRGLAAVAVLVGHARHLFFVGSDDVSHLTIPLSVFYFLSSFGHQAVIVFFVLSGFFVGSSVLRARQQQRWSWSTYLTTRLTRLYIVLLPALLMGIVWDQLGMTFGHPETYFRDLQDFGLVVGHRSNLSAFLGSLFFVQGITAPSFGSNAALRSLASEFWYYILFPLLIGVVSTAGSWARYRRIAQLLLIAFVVVGIGKGIALYFTIWLLGVAVALAGTAQLWNVAWRIRLTILLAISSVTIAAVARFGIHGEHFLTDFAVAIVFALFLYAILLGPPLATAWTTYAKVARSLAKCSYTTYLAHLPILVLIRSLSVSRARWQPDTTHLLAWSAILMVVAAYIWCMYALTESNTEYVRMRVLSYTTGFGGVLKSYLTSCTNKIITTRPIV